MFQDKELTTESHLGNYSLLHLFFGRESQCSFDFRLEFETPRGIGLEDDCSAVAVHGLSSMSPCCGGPPGHNDLPVALSVEESCKGPSKSLLSLSNCLSHTWSITVAQVLDLSVNRDPLRGDVHLSRLHSVSLLVAQAR